MTEALTDTVPPDGVADEKDHGAATQTRYRYQYAYGVIMLCGAVGGEIPYTALWCEHHEDFLARRIDGTFDAFQLKTKQPSLGPWKLSDKGLHTALKGFCRLHSRFGAHISSFLFVSNTDLFHSTESKKAKQSLAYLMDAVRTRSNVEELDEGDSEVLATLASKLSTENPGIPKCQLFDVIRRLKFQKGPSLEDFEDALAHTHISSLTVAASASAEELNALRDAAIRLVWQASCQRSDDPAKHWYCLLGSDGQDPQLSEKEITVKDFTAFMGDRAIVPFRYVRDGIGLSIAEQSGSLTRFEKKVLRGGLRGQLGIFRRRTVSAEGHLFKLQHQNPQKFDETLSHLEAVVQGECEDAKLVAEANGQVYGKEMMRVLQERLRSRVEARPETVFNQDYDCLMGVAGLLTEACKVWWSPEFDVEADS